MRRAWWLILAVLVAACGSTPPNPPASAPARATPTTAPVATAVQTPVPSPSPTPAPSASQAPGRVPVPSTPAKLAVLPTTPGMTALAFPDVRHGWLAGSGEILGTADGGRTWRVQWHEPNMLVSEVEALDATHAWAFAQHYAADGTLSRQTVLRTTDGRHWAAVRVPHTMLGLVFTSVLSGWAVDQGVVPHGMWTAAGVGESAGRLDYTGDGGRTWTATGVRDVDAVCFDGARLGWAAGPSGVWATADGGRTWRRVGPEPDHASSFAMTLACRGGRLWLFQDLLGAATGNREYAGWTSTDGGRRWTQVLQNSWFPTGVPASVATADAYPGPLASPSASLAVEAGWSPNGSEVSLTVTRDGGRTWRTARIPGIEGAPRIAAPDARHWLVLAEDMPGRPALVATSDGGRTWQELWPTTAPAPVGGVAFVSATRGYGVVVPGDDRAVVATSDGGTTWSRVAELPESAATTYAGSPTLSFPDASHGWVVTTTGHLLATADGGRTWRRTALPAGSGPAGLVTFANASRGCVAIGASDGPVSGELRTADGGRTWTAVPSPVYPVTGCARGDAAAPVVASAARLAQGQVLDLSFLDDRTAWLLTDGALWWTADGGATWGGAAWPPDPANPQAMFGGVQQVQFVSASTGWLVGADRALFRTDDGGRTWAQVR